MNLSSITILGIRITTSSKKDIFSFIQSSKKKLLYIVTPNPEQLVYAQKDNHFAQILNDADIALPDGIGLVVAMRLFSQLPTTNYQLLAAKRIPGVEFMEDLVELAAKHGWPVAFIGGRGGVAEAALARLKKKYTGLVGWAEEPSEYHTYNDYNFYNYYIKIRKTNTKLVFVGLGAPKQEYLIARLRDKMVRGSDGQMVERQTQPSSHQAIQPLVFMSVGGSFDILAGSVRRAPVLIRSIGLEWLWRLVLEPWRFRRQLALIKFLWLVISKKLA